MERVLTLTGRRIILLHVSFRCHSKLNVWHFEGIIPVQYCCHLWVTDWMVKTVEVSQPDRKTRERRITSQTVHLHVGGT